jgi:hypothetical protein
MVLNATKKNKKQKTKNKKNGKGHLGFYNNCII